MEVSCRVDPETPQASLMYKRHIADRDNPGTIAGRRIGSSEGFSVIATVTNNTDKTIHKVFVKVKVAHDNRGIFPRNEDNDGLIEA